MTKLRYVEGTDEREYQWVCAAGCLDVERVLYGRYNEARSRGERHAQRTGHRITLVMTHTRTTTYEREGS